MGWIALTIHTRDQMFEEMNIEGGYDEARCAYRSEFVEGLMENSGEKGGCFISIGGEWVWCKEGYEDIIQQINDSEQE